MVDMKKLQRCCLLMCAWSLSNAERAKVREYFVAMDVNRSGKILMDDLQSFLTGDAGEYFKRLASIESEVSYSDFLAAMVTDHIGLSESLMRAAFKRFDQEAAGHLDASMIANLANDFYFEQDEPVTPSLNKMDTEHLGIISFEAFVDCARGGRTAQQSTG